ncbi:MAG: cyclophilin-like fold protein [Ignavibacteria bacterium]|jgi:flavodoxin
MKKIFPVLLFLITSFLHASPGKTLIVYYSWSGNTQKIANEIQELVGGDLLKVEVATPYTASSDQELYPIASQEIKAIDNEGIYPEIATEIDSLDEYDTVFICYPLWHSRMATPMQSFLNKYGNQLAGKTVPLFCTSASSGIAGTVEDAHRLCPNANFIDALWIRAYKINDSQDELIDWLKENDLYSINEIDGNKVNVIIGDRTFIATLNDSEAAEVFKTLLPITVDMTDLNNNEKFYWLETNFPGTATNPGMIYSGDLMIWSSRCLVLYYDSFNTAYSFIKIGQIDDAAGLADAVGSGNVTVTFELASTTDIDGESGGLEIPNKFSLGQNYPNPFNPATAIQYTIPNAGQNGSQLVKLKVYNLLGKEVATIVNEAQTAGSYQVEFDGSQLSSGVYFYQLETGNFTDIKKLILLK